MSKFTPGPWEAFIQDNGTHHVDAGIYSVCDLYHINRNSPGVFTKENAIANARLIAAAPDLLEALEMCAEYVSDVPIVRIAVRRALAKAKGEDNG